LVLLGRAAVAVALAGRAAEQQGPVDYMVQVVAAQRTQITELPLGVLGRTASLSSPTHPQALLKQLA
jgi:hypothetical protein